MLTSAKVPLDTTLIDGDLATVFLNCCGVGIAISAPPTFLDQMPRSFFPGAAVGNLARLQIKFNVRVSNVFEIYENGDVVSICSTLEDAIQALEGSVQQAIAANASERAFLHAGVVGFKGKAILIPGRSHAGKTTLVMALVEAGSTYYSDEYALLDAEGFVHAFPRAPRIRHATGKFLMPATDDLAPLPAGLVVMTNYQPKTSWNPKRLSAGECLFGLIDNAVGIQAHPELYLSRLKQIALTANAFSSPRGEARQVVNEILQLFHRGENN